MLKKITLVTLAGGAIACGQAFAQGAQFAYVVNQYSQYVEGYKVDPPTGALIALPTSPYNTGLTDMFAMAADLEPKAALREARSAPTLARKG